LIYNFRIITLGHFSFKILSLWRSNSAKPKSFQPGTRPRARRRAGTPRLPAPCIAVFARRGWPLTTGPCAEPCAPVRDAPIRLVGATWCLPTCRQAARARWHWVVAAALRHSPTSHVVSHAATHCSGWC
jgi:hypothetical protein